MLWGPAALCIGDLCMRCTPWSWPRTWRGGSSGEGGLCLPGTKDNLHPCSPGWHGHPQPRPLPSIASLGCRWEPPPCFLTARGHCDLPPCPERSGRARSPPRRAPLGTPSAPEAALPRCATGWCRLGTHGTRSGFSPQQPSPAPSCTCSSPRSARGPWAQTLTATPQRPLRRPESLVKGWLTGDSLLLRPAQAVTSPSPCISRPPI